MLLGEGSLFQIVDPNSFFNSSSSYSFRVHSGRGSTDCSDGSHHQVAPDRPQAQNGEIKWPTRTLSIISRRLNHNKLRIMNCLRIEKTNMARSLSSSFAYSRPIPVAEYLGLLDSPSVLHANKQTKILLLFCIGVDSSRPNRGEK